jgi:hypothetical protein
MALAVNGFLSPFVHVTGRACYLFFFCLTVGKSVGHLAYQCPVGKRSGHPVQTWVASRIDPSMRLPAALPHRPRIDPSSTPHQPLIFFLTTGQFFLFFLKFEIYLILAC